MVAFFVRSCFVYAAFSFGSVMASDAVSLSDSIESLDAFLLQKDENRLRDTVARLTDTGRLTLYSLIAPHVAVCFFAVCKNRCDELCRALMFWRKHAGEGNSLKEKYGNWRSRLNL